jgi:hypothetical protein
MLGSHPGRLFLPQDFLGVTLWRILARQHCPFLQVPIAPVYSNLTEMHNLLGLSSLKTVLEQLLCTLG